MKFNGIPLIALEAVGGEPLNCARALVALDFEDAFEEARATAERILHCVA